MPDVQRLKDSQMYNQIHTRKQAEMADMSLFNRD